jgi:hypothetical protein
LVSANAWPAASEHATASIGPISLRASSFMVIVPFHRLHRQYKSRPDAG